ncbi:MAG: S41 family peptidase [Chlamydiota bacterium]
MDVNMATGKRFIFLIFFVFFIGFSHFLFSENLSPVLKKNTHYSIEEMLSYHVEHKQFSPLLLKRSVKLFFDQFDPYKVYLLQSEVTAFSEMSEAHLEKAAFDHRMSDYLTYEEMDRSIGAAILRARECREEVAKEFMEKGYLEVDLRQVSSSFSKTRLLLVENIKQFMSSLIEAEKKQEKLVETSLADRKEILALLEKRIRKSEEEYLALDGGHFLSMHIIKAFAKSLDAHTCFFTPEEAQELRMNLEKQFEGIGIVFREGIRGIAVKSMIRKGPAEKSKKIEVGDVLIAVNGRLIGDSSYQEAMAWLKGNKGGRVSLAFLKKEGETVSVELIREKIVLDEERLHYSSIPYADGIIGVMHLPSFYENSDGISAEKDMKLALRELKKQGKLLGLIVDVRNNTGGFLSQAVKVASLFMSSGVVVISKYAKDQMQYLRDINGQIFYQGPLVFLTSKLSASATEIVTQALQDYGIALIVGDHRTYGKGSIQYQTVTEEKTSTYFKVTIGKYYTVSGRSTQIEGVKADVVIPTKYAPFNIGEKYLLYALKNDQVPSAFLDSCADIDERNLSWFYKNYIPNLQKKLSCWTGMLPILKKNSEYRLSHDKNFLAFLEVLQSKPSLAELQEGGVLHFGSEDIQMSEVLNIVKDMTILQAEGKKNSSLRK